MRLALDVEMTELGMGQLTYCLQLLAHSSLPTGVVEKRNSPWSSVFQVSGQAAMLGRVWAWTQSVRAWSQVTGGREKPNIPWCISHRQNHTVGGWGTRKHAKSAVLGSCVCTLES